MHYQHGPGCFFINTCIFSGKSQSTPGINVICDALKEMRCSITKPYPHLKRVSLIFMGLEVFLILRVIILLLEEDTLFHNLEVKSITYLKSVTTSCWCIPLHFHIDNAAVSKYILGGHFPNIPKWSRRQTLKWSLLLSLLNYFIVRVHLQVRSETILFYKTIWQQQWNYHHQAA